MKMVVDNDKTCMDLRSQIRDDIWNIIWIVY